MQTNQIPRTDLETYFELGNLRKNICLELHKRKVSQRENHKLTGLSYYNFKLSPINIDLTNLTLIELIQLTQKTKREYDTIFFQLRSRSVHPKRFCCCGCGRKLEIKNFHRSSKRSYCLSCWKGKLI
jgi:hypothetical protein